MVKKDKNRFKDKYDKYNGYNGDSDDNKKAIKSIKKSNALPIAMIIFTLIILIGAAIAYSSPDTFNKIANGINNYSNSNNNNNNNMNINNYSNGSNINNDYNNSVSINSSNQNISNQSSSNPKEGYSQLTIHGFKCFIKSEYMDFKRISDKTDFTNASIVSNNLNISNSFNISNNSNSSDSLSSSYSSSNIYDDSYLAYVGNSTVDLFDYNDFSKLRSKNGSFDIEIINISNSSNTPNTLNTPNNLNTSNSSNSSNISKYSTNSFNNRIAIEYSNGNVISDKTLMILGNEVRFISYGEYSQEGWRGPKTIAYFRLNNSDIAIAWEGNQIDSYVIESFFKLN
ncbi:MAG: hypothetical protein LBM26_00745 [Methanobrevibacter sp.]|jgi:hypothetical protein|nr:hypothetical protein [Methanobrevibacter sp.]